MKRFGFTLLIAVGHLAVTLVGAVEDVTGLGFSKSAVFPSQQTMDGWANDLDLTFKRLTNGESDVTGASHFESKYQTSVSENGGFEILHADSAKIVHDMAEKIAKIFDRNIAALKNLQESAESLIESYQYDEDLTLNKISYANVNDLKNISEQMIYDNHYKQDVYFKSSGIQIPLEIYEGYNSNQMSRICPTCTSVCDLCSNGLYWRRDALFNIIDTNIVKNPDILNGIKWSERLDEVFQRNRQEFPDIYWQSFGANDGYLRVYPAVRWPVVDGLPDLFDVRRRPWYINGVSSPKDVVILLDTSGSMHGQSFDIMKVAAKTLLNTLSENDYVNVARFSRNVTWVTPCLTTLVQANARNKRLLFDGIDSLTDHNVASYSKALEFAYNALEEFEGTRSIHEGADCHKLIMVFSDGGTEYPAKIIKVFSNKTREITRSTRIFSYAVGPHPLPTVALKKMACDTGGSFTTITSMGAIRTKIQDYVRVLSKPLVLAQSVDYLKTTFKDDHLGLGFITTVTLPVFNLSSHSDNQTLAGIVGVDIPVFTFNSFAPRSQLGPLGYSFGVNSNGFSIWHPDMWTVANYLEDPAHNDFAEIEGEIPDLVKLREELVEFAFQRGEGQKSKLIEVPILMQNGHAAKLTKDYHYGSIRGTSFAIGLAVPHNWDYIRTPPQDDAQLHLRRLNRVGTFVAPWKFCDESKMNPDIDAESIEEIIKALQVDKCHGDDLNHLVWDIKNTFEVFESLKLIGIKSNFLSRFVMTDGGLTIFKPQEKLEDFKSLHFDPYNSTLFRFAVVSDKPVLFVQKYETKEVIPLYHVMPSFDTNFEQLGDEDIDESPSLSELASHSTVSDRKSKKGSFEQPKIVMKPPKETTIHLAKAFRINKNGRNYTAGVAGVHLSQTYLQQLLIDHTPSPEGELSCRNFSDIRCYFIDFSGYIIASNQPRAEVGAGDFLGTVDEQIMEHLVKNGFFLERPEFNYMALCPDPVNCTTDSSTVLRSMFGSIVNSVVVLVKSVVAFAYKVNYTLVSVLAALYWPLEEVGAVSEYGYRIADGLHRCTTKTSNWFLNDESPVLYRDRIVSTCDGNQCARNFHLYRMQNINGILIIADYKCNFCKAKRYFDGPVEVDTGEECLLPNRYRKRPVDCFATHGSEIFECSSAGILQYGMNLMISCFLFQFLLFQTSSFLP